MDFGSANISDTIIKPVVDRNQASIADSSTLTKIGSVGRRKPSTTEAKRRTSLEDDEEEEEALSSVRISDVEGDDDDLVEVKHEEGN